MPKKCKECPKIDVKENEEIFDGMKTYNFAKLWLRVKAKSLEEAEKKVKAMTNYENKSI